MNGVKVSSCDSIGGSTTVQGERKRKEREREKREGGREREREREKNMRSSVVHHNTSLYPLS